MTSQPAAPNDAAPNAAKTPPKSATPTWRRRLLHLGRRLGLTVTDVAPGTVLLNRGARAPRLLAVKAGLSVLATGKNAAKIRVQELRDQAWLVSAGGVRVAELGEHGWLVDPVRAGGVRVAELGEHGWLVDLVRDEGVDVAMLGKRGWLVTEREQSLGARAQVETQALVHLGNRHVAWLLEKYRVDLVLDVGANNGQFASALRRDGYRGHIASFEPVPRFAETLEKRAEKDDKWTVHQLALGSTEGTVPIHVQRTFSSLLPSSDYGKRRWTTLRELSDTEQVDVPLRRLDSILDDLLEPVRASGIDKPRVYLKMDTQGFDLEVFRGLGDRVKDIAGLQSEVALLLIYDGMPRMPEAIAAYEAAGFEISGLYPVTREPDGRIIEYDCMMVRASALTD